MTLDIDARNTYCPQPILLLAKAMKNATPGDTLRVQATDPGFDPDVRAWCRSMKQELVSLVQASGVITAEIRKR